MRSRLLLFGFCLLPLAATADPSLSFEQERLFAELRACLNALPRQGASTAASPCAGKDVRALAGTARAAFATTLGHPDWCRSAQGQITPWSEQSCASAPAWGYAFYRLAGVGGGPELEVRFGDHALSTTFTWVHTQ